MNLENAGKATIVLGLVLIVTGALLYAGARLGMTRLPGDIVWRGDRMTVYVPVGLSILASIVLTVVLNLVLRR